MPVNAKKETLYGLHLFIIVTSKLTKRGTKKTYNNLRKCNMPHNHPKMLKGFVSTTVPSENKPMKIKQDRVHTQTHICVCVYSILFILLIYI